jgi:hypothetical protein
MLGILIGVFAILLGAKAFTPKGLPLTRKKHLTGTTAKIVGVACILVGALFIIDGVYAITRMVPIISGTGR